MSDRANVNSQMVGLAYIEEYLMNNDPDNPALPIIQARRMRLEEATDEICDRFGIARNLADLPKWALIGYHLAAQEPEFKSPRKRGRPQVKVPKSVWQAHFVDFVKQYLPHLTDLEIINFLKLVRGNAITAPLTSLSAESMLARVSEGRRLRAQLRKKTGE